MPLFRRQPAEASAAPAPTAPSTPLLAELLGQQPQTPVETAPRPARRSTPRESTYDVVMRYIATFGALAVCAGMWGGGAYFTVIWLQSRLPTMPYAWLLWVIPFIITALEIGYWPSRLSGVSSRIAWLAILIFDAGTTGAGMFPSIPTSISTLTLDELARWVIAIVVGIGLALVPEKWARGIISENF